MPSSPYAEKVKRFREERAWSQEHLANVSGVSSRTIQRIEGGVLASQESLMALANVFGMEVAELIRKNPYTDTPVEHQQEAKQPGIIFLLRIHSGNELFELTKGACSVDMSNDELMDEDEVSLVGDLFGELADWNDVWHEISPKHRVEQEFIFTGRIQELEKHGLWTFAEQTTLRMRLKNNQVGENEVQNWTFAFVYVLRSNNPKIVKHDSRKDHIEFVPVQLPKSFRFA